MKAKTHKSTVKRFKITSGKKLMHKPAGVSHLRVNKSPRHTADVMLHAADVKRISKALPNS